LLYPVVPAFLVETKEEKVEMPSTSVWLIENRQRQAKLPRKKQKQDDSELSCEGQDMVSC